MRVLWQGALVCCTNVNAGPADLAHAPFFRGIDGRVDPRTQGRLQEERGSKCQHSHHFPQVRAAALLALSTCVPLLCLPPPPRVAYSALDASMSFFHNFHNALMEYRVGDLTFKVLELEHARFRSRKLVRLGWAHDGEWPAKLK